jgi:hypothetical protein
VGDAVTRALGLLALLFCLTGFTPGDPAWTACDRLDARRGAPRPGRLWLGGGLTSWDALPGALESRIGAGWEPVRGGGARVSWRSLSWAEGLLSDLEAGVIWRGTRWRGEWALGQARFAGHHATRCSPRLLIAVSPHLVAGGSVTLYPGSPQGAPEFEVEARAAAGPWLLGLVLHENASEAEVGIEVRSHLVVLARYANDVPALGIVLEARALQLRAEAEDHPLLGRTARVALRWTRGGS